MGVWYKPVQRHKHRHLESWQPGNSESRVFKVELPPPGPESQTQFAALRFLPLSTPPRSVIRIATTLSLHSFSLPYLPLAVSRGKGVPSSP